MSRFIIISLLICFSGFSGLCRGQQPVSSPLTLAQKATRAFLERDWPSAQAHYILQCNDNPTDSVAVARLIVSDCALGDTVAAVDALANAMTAGASIDKILLELNSQSFLVGDSDVYINFMLAAQKMEPWMQRAIEARILPYYEFRDNGPEIIRYSLKMLSGLPQSVKYLHSLAKGYVLTGETPSAAETWKEILNIDPDDFTSLISLGNYYFNNGVDDLAQIYLSKAFDLKPTPFVEKRLKEITKRHKKK